MKNASRKVILLNFIFALHAIIPVYFFSSHISQFTNSENLASIYLISSFILLLIMFTIDWFSRYIGSYYSIAIFLCLDIISITGMIFGNTEKQILLSFIGIFISVNMINVFLDINLDKISKIKKTGGIRGTNLTLISIAWLIAPLIGIPFIDQENFLSVFIISLSILLPFIYMYMKNISDISSPQDIYADNHPFLNTLINIFKNRFLRIIFFSQITINVFYAWMIIYMPIYLRYIIGLSWTKILIIFSLMMIPFIVFDYPIGKIIDKYKSFNPFIYLGFCIGAFALVMMPFAVDLDIKSAFLVWLILMIFVRIGVAFVETATESYFFKIADARDFGLISAFRMTRPIAYIITTVFVIYLGNHIDFSMFFYILSALFLIPPLLIRKSISNKQVVSSLETI